MESLSCESYWRQSGHRPLHSYEPLSGDRRVDVAIIGGGITGLSAAMLLKQAGKEVLVLEAGCVGAGTTGGTSAHLDIMPDQGCTQLLHDFGEEAGRQAIAARRRAIDQIETWATRFGIACDFRRIPAFAYTERSDRVDRLRKEYEAAQRLGVNAAWQTTAGLPFSTSAAIQIEQQARFHALDYLHGLAAAVHGENATICEHTRAEVPRDGDPCVIEANGKRVQATEVILATHSAFLGISQFDMRQAPYQSYMLVVRVEDELPDALFWDDEEPYHYTRRAASHEPNLLLIGGADHKTGHGHEQEHFQKLERYARDRFRVTAIEGRWSAEFFEPADGLPMIGRVPATGHLYIGTGYSGTGLTYGTAAAGVLADLILTGTSVYTDVFSPMRFKPMAAAKDLISENLDVAKRFVGDRVKVERVESLESVARGEGKIVHYQGETLAVYRDEQNQLHCNSPVCTHSGCFVQWNNAESTWDCPCHGGRYSATGERLYGPPPADLKPKDPHGAMASKESTRT